MVTVVELVEALEVVSVFEVPEVVTVVNVVEVAGTVEFGPTVVVVTAAAHPPDKARTTAKMPADTNNRRTAVRLALCLRIVAGMVGYLVVQVNDARGVRLA